MNWPSFLKQLEIHTALTLVGPLYGAPYAPKQPTIYVDGGSHFRPSLLSVAHPVISLGDGDSGGVMDETLPVEKDYSDLAFVLRELPPHITTLRLLGFLGGRRDHELANLGEVHQFLKMPRLQQARATLEENLQPRVIGFTGSMQLDAHGSFSILVLEPAMVKLQGCCKYKLNGEREVEPASSLGLSNEGFGPVLIESAKPCFIFLNEVV